MTVATGSGRGGRRPGAGRKPGTPNRTREQIAIAKAERAAKKAAKERAQDHRQAPAAPPREPAGKLEILPPIDVPIPPDVEPLDFLRHLMRNETLPLGFRRDCAALALPYAHPKPLPLGLKDQRNLAAMDDDEDDIARALRG
jgi:hypothetical protein